MEMFVYQDILVNALRNHCCERVKQQPGSKVEVNLGEGESRFRYKCVTNPEGTSWS